MFTGLKIRIDAMGASGIATIKLGYDGVVPIGLNIETVSPATFVTPSATPVRISPETSEFAFKFSQDIAFVSGKVKTDIQLWSSNSLITTGWDAIIDGKDLKIVFDESLATNKDYTVIIPRGTICATTNATIINSTNLNMGFVTAGGSFVPAASMSFAGGNSTTIYGVGKEFNLLNRVNILPANATLKNVIFSSSNDSVAVIDEATGMNYLNRYRHGGHNRYDDRREQHEC